MQRCSLASARKSAWIVVGALGVMLVGAGAVYSAPQAGIYTAEQAGRGERLFTEQCVTCHREDWAGRRSDGGPPLRGLPFTTKWGGQSILALFSTMEELMPAKHPGSLTRAQYADAVSYILKVNGLPAGSTPLPEAPAAQKRILLRFVP